MAEDGALVNALRGLFGEGVRVISKTRAGGGSINQASVLTLSDGNRAFLKVNRTRDGEFFEAEAAGLRALASDEGPRVVRFLANGEDASGRFLLLEYIESAPPRADFWEDFGRRLARLHRTRRSPRFGFQADNYIGATPQLNTWSDNWPDFFGRMRLGHQIELARRGGRADRALVAGVERILARLGELLPSGEEASLLHGDLWGGNYLVGPEGYAVLIDPAVYYGDREADLAMTELFGGFPERFYAAYQEEYPLLEGSAERRDLYNLYHLLNHLNLFGASYLQGVRSTVARYS